MWVRHRTRLPPPAVDTNSLVSAKLGASTRVLVLAVPHAAARPSHRSIDRPIDTSKLKHIFCLPCEAGWDTLIVFSGISGASGGGGQGAPQGAGREREAQQLVAPAGAEALAAPPVLRLRLARARLARQTLCPRPSVAHDATDLTLTNTFKHQSTRPIDCNQPPARANESCCQNKSELLPYLVHGGRAATKRAASGARQGTTAISHLQ